MLSFKHFSHLHNPQPKGASLKENRFGFRIEPTWEQTQTWDKGKMIQPQGGSLKGVLYICCIWKIQVHNNSFKIFKHMDSWLIKSFLQRGKKIKIEL